LLIANRKFCRHIMTSSPGTAIEFFRAMSRLRKYRIPIGQFASNISTEALLNEDSILYHEDEGYYSGFFGYARPFTIAVYGDFHLVEALSEGNSPLDIDHNVRLDWDARQLKAYTRAVLTTFRSAIEQREFYNHSYALYRAIYFLRGVPSDLCRLNDMRSGPDADDIHESLAVAVRFVNDAIDVLDKYGVQKTLLRRRRSEPQSDYYDYLAEFMFEVLFNASSVKTREFVSWSVQHNAVWSQFFNLHMTPTRKLILFKLRRLLYDELLQLEYSPNYRCAAILGYLLNVLGVKAYPRNRRLKTGDDGLRKVVVSWAKRNYLRLVKRHHKVAAAVLIGTISFDEERRQLVKTYAQGLSLTPSIDTLDLEEPCDVV
jgi:hypothetical protein